MISPYNTSPHSDTHVTTGSVLQYRPTTRTYDVNVFGHGVLIAKQLYAGINRPYVQGTRVALAKCVGTDWFIIGEIPTVGIGVPLDTEESAILATERSRLEALLTPDTARNYTDVDASGQAAPLVREGDVRIETGAANQLSKGFIHMYRGGDILLAASNACYTLYSRLKRAIVTRALDLFENLAGFTRRIETRATDDGYTTTYTSTVRSDPLQGEPDIQVRAGYLGDTDIRTGAEVRYSDGYIQIADKRACRVKLGDAWLVMGELAHSADTGFSKEGIGIQLHTARGTLTISDDTQHIRLALADGKTAVDILDSGISIVQGSTSLSMTPDAITVSAPTVNITAADTIDIVAGRNIALTAPQIDLN